MQNDRNPKFDKVVEQRKLAEADRELKLIRYFQRAAEEWKDKGL